MALGTNKWKLSFLLSAVLVGATVPDKQGYTSSSNERGTLDIVWTCLFTVFICCWNVAHPDISLPGSAWWRELLDKSFCMLVTAIAPEILLYTAFYERQQAVESSKQGPPSWTSTHAFYANMGGFCNQDIGTTDEEKIGYYDADCMISLWTQKRISIKQIPHTAEIRDKGKADNLVKALALLQVLWLVAQCIARPFTGLSTTTLEISTFAFVPAAFATFWLWWHKPYQIRQPTYIQRHHLPPDESFIGARNLPPASKNVSMFTSWHRHQPIERDEIMSAQLASTISSSQHGSLFPDGKNHLKTQRRRFEPNDKNMEMISSEDPGQPSHAIVSRYSRFPLWRVCWEAVIPTLYTIDPKFAALTSIFCIVFGGIHCAAWNFEFPTPWERIAWRACSVILTGTLPFAWFCTSMLGAGIQTVVKRRNRDLSLAGEKRLLWLIHITHGMVLITYILARFYLLFEAFYSLRSLPSGCYKTVNWAAVLPILS